MNTIKQPEPTVDISPADQLVDNLRAIELATPEEDAIIQQLETQRISIFVLMAGLLPSLMVPNQLGGAYSSEVFVTVGVAAGASFLGAMNNFFIHEEIKKRLSEIKNGSPILRRDVS
jgi:hypothetical protein